jgi:hypothetical protein
MMTMLTHNEGNAMLDTIQASTMTTLLTVSLTLRAFEDEDLGMRITQIQCSFYDFACKNIPHERIQFNQPVVIIYMS